MKTLRYREGNLVKPGILDKDGIIRDASSLVHDWDSSTVTVEKLNFLQSQDHSNLPTVNDLASIAPCVAET